MLKFEKKLIEWINSHMVAIALCFVIVAGAWMRLAGSNFVGIDYHYSLYDIPGNCNSLFYRIITGFLMKTDYAIVLLKLLAYAGDFCVAFLTLLLFYKENQKLTDLRTFLVITACLLSPVALMYSVGGMKIDSVCMSLLLLGILVYKKAGFLFAVPVMMLSAFIYTAYWPVVLGISMFIVLKQEGSGDDKRKMAAGVAVLVVGALLSVFVENLYFGKGYYWVKVFVVNPETGVAYENLFEFLLGLGKIYGYFVAMGSLLISFENRRWRVPALILQVLTIMYVGWKMTAHLGI